MATETFGSPLSEVVQNQLTNRSRLNLKGLSYLENGQIQGPGRVQPFLQKQLFNSAWINLISSVDNTDTQAEERDRNSNLARRLVLSGGSLRWDGQKLVKREGVDFEIPDVGTYGTQSAYNRNTQTGVRPMPGITGFKVVSKNLFGTLREATVEFVVWSLPELEDIERLYFRPGYHVIIEWGHTYSLDNEGNPTSFPISLLLNYDKFFTQNSANTIYNAIENTRNKNFGNYDGFLGIVKNFSWTFRQDGGYDCSISVISKGEILESLTVRSGFPSSTQVNQNASNKSEDDFYESNLLTRFVKVLKSANEQASSTAQSTSTSTQANSTFAAAVAGFATSGFLGLFQGIAASKNIRFIGDKGELVLSLEDIEKSMLTANIRFEDVISYLKVYGEETGNSYFAIRKKLTEKTEWYKAFSTPKELSIVYVSLDLVLYMLNRFIEVSSTSSKIGLFNDKSQETFFTFDNFVNLDPSSCVLPVVPTYTPKDTTITKTLFPFFTEKLRINSTRILDILITTDTLDTVLREFINTLEDPEEFDVISFVKTLLKKLETTLGGINEFDLIYSEETNLHTIIDRRYEEKSKKEDIPILNVYGAASLALDLNIQTKITNKLGAQISIAAQGPDGDAQFNSSMPEFKKWNKNLIDRFDEINKPDPADTNVIGANTVVGSGAGTTSGATTSTPSQQNAQTAQSTPFNPRAPITPQQIANAFQNQQPFNTAPADATRVAPPVSLQNAAQAIENYENSYDAFYAKLEQAYKQWWEGIFQPQQDHWASLQTQGQTIYSMIASDFKISKGLPPQGIIPTVISLTVEGIGGIKIGQTFRINEGILPKKYAQFGYITTGIEHSIENNKWVTSINAQTYYLGSPSQEEIDKAKERIGRFYPYKQGTTTSTSGSNTSTSSSTSSPPAQRSNGKTGTGSASTRGTSYSHVPYLDPPPPIQNASYKDIKSILLTKTDECTAKAVFAVLVAEASKNKDKTGLTSAGGFNFGGVQTDVGVWGGRKDSVASSKIVARYRKIDSGNNDREFAQFKDLGGFLEFMIDRVKFKKIGCTEDTWTDSYIQSWWSPAAKVNSTHKKGGETYRNKANIFKTAMNIFNKS